MTQYETSKLCQKNERVGIKNRIKKKNLYISQSTVLSLAKLPI